MSLAWFLTKVAHVWPPPRRSRTERPPEAWTSLQKAIRPDHGCCYGGAQCDLVNGGAGPGDSASQRLVPLFRPWPWQPAGRPGAVARTWYGVRTAARTPSLPEVAGIPAERPEAVRPDQAGSVAPGLKRAEPAGEL